jgi:hypothetical protein
MDNSSLMIVDQKVIEERKREFIPRLRELIVNGKKLTDEQVVGRADFAASQGLDPISECHTLVTSDGKTMSHTMAVTGYRRKCQEQAGLTVRIDKEFLDVTKQYVATFQNILLAYECRVRVGSDYTEWQKSLVEVGKAFKDAGVEVSFDQMMQTIGPAPVHTGIGFFYQDETNPYKDKNFNPIERCKKRAEVNALGHRFPRNAPMWIGDENTIISDTIDGDFIDKSSESSKSITPQQAIDDLYGAPSHNEPHMTTDRPLLDEAVDLGGEVTEMPIEMAQEVKNSKGILYTDLDTKTLQSMANSLAKVLKENIMPPEEREEKVYKLAAARSILASRVEVK